MLKTKLFQAFAALVLVFGLLSAFVGTRIIRSRVVAEAQNQVTLDLRSAWAIYESRLNDIQTVLNLIAVKKAVADAAAESLWASADLQQRLGVIQRNFGLDFLTVVSPSGETVLRAAAPHNTGDYVLDNPAVSRALKGHPVFGVTLLSATQLRREAEDLEERAFMALEQTPHSRPTSRKEESRGMVMIGAVPLLKGPQLIGVIYGGVLLNRDFDIVDRITSVIYKDELYKGKPMGTATLFLNDTRIATTVRHRNGNRATGTRASKEVADQVLDNGRSWVGPAFVVSGSYLTAYDPIRDFDDRVIGMLYVGRLEEPFKDLGNHIMLRYAGLLVFGLGAALILAFIVAGKLAQPIHRLVEASIRMHKGEAHSPVRCRSSCREIEDLVVAFNEMATSLEERESRLKEANEKLERANDALTGLNRSYMDMLGFVSHELKSPIASIMNYAFLLRQRKIGPLTPAQEKAVANIENSSKRIVEMVRHYLNLSRIETGELHPVTTKVPVLADVVGPLLESVEADIEAKHMKLDLRIDERTLLRCDLNMVREVFENLISNGIKYGREGGLLRIEEHLSEDFVEFAVFNEGTGIAPDKFETVFQKFSRLDDDQAIRRQKGTGLGLFITKHIVQAHGGRIEVRSEPQQWVEFRFTLPRYKEEERK